MSDTKPPYYYTTLSGCPIEDPQATLRVGPKPEGPLVLRDFNLIEILSHATHERIPERLVHAKGAGARGFFEVTSADIANYTDASFLSKLGQKTDLRVRFSTVAGGRGSADTVRDTRGFAFKLYTDEGNLDWLFFSEPVFPIRDGGKFPSFVHCLKGVPKTNLFDPSTFWEFVNANSEAYHAILMIFSDRGTPQGYEFSEIFGLNTYKFTKNPPESGQPPSSPVQPQPQPQAATFLYTKIHMKPTLGVKNFTWEEATKQAGLNPDYHSQSLYACIENAKAGKGPFPQWDVFAQLMTYDQAQNQYSDIVFDPTKVWPQKDFPLIPFGRITLNENPDNFFQEVEQISFNPTSLVPGWDVSPDPILQTRLFAYGSAARYRLGVNFMQTVANRPKYSYNPTCRDGAGCIENLQDLPNYIPGDQNRVRIVKKPSVPPEHEEWVGRVTAYNSPVSDADYVQPRDFWAVLGKGDDGATQQEHLVENVARNLSKARSEIRDASYAIFTKIDAELGKRIQEKTEEVAAQSMATTQHYLL